MRVALLVVTALLVSVVALGLALAAGPSWLLWPASVFAALLLVAAAMHWVQRQKPPIGWLVPFALVLVAVIAVALASPGATSWVLWPALVAALVAIVAGLGDIFERRPKPAA